MTTALGQDGYGRGSCSCRWQLWASEWPAVHLNASRPELRMPRLPVKTYDAQRLKFGVAAMAGASHHADPPSGVLPSSPLCVTCV
jgi:hypothetical protein